jgi:hypothetical protein
VQPQPDDQTDLAVNLLMPNFGAGFQAVAGVVTDGDSGVARSGLLEF